VGQIEFHSARCESDPEAVISDVQCMDFEGEFNVKENIEYQQKIIIFIAK